MKKILSLLLCAVMLALALASCAVDDSQNISANISVASSAAESYALWLTDRLGLVPDNVIMAVGEDNSYGIDMSDFEDDGYVIKNVNGDILLLGKTGEGLDLAARKYANSVDLDRDIEDVVYHEGYRVEKFTMFGRDISEYTVVYPEEHNENMSFAVSEFVRLIKQACGAELTVVVGETDASPLIRFEYSDKEELDIGGYEYFEENGDLVFSSAVREGSTNAVYRFLENECDWEWLIYGNSDLQETDHLIIETGLYKTETPAFEWHIVSRNMSNLPFESDKTVKEQRYLNMTAAQQSYPVKHANHGMSRYNWANWITNNHTGQICYTSESNYDTVLYNILKYLKEKEEAGEIIGETIRDIDMAQGDSGMYCQCGECFAVNGEEGSILGPVVRFANGIAEEVNAEYPGADLIFKIFAYYGALQAPKVTMPNEWLSVSYAPNGACANHTMDGKNCDPDVNTFLQDSGCDFGRYLAEWCAVSDNMYVWYYHIGTSFNYYNCWNLIYHDYKYMHELGVKGVYFYNYARGMGPKTVEHMLAWYLLWDIDMTWEEYEALYDRILEEEYGDGWQYMKELLRVYGEAQNDNCWNCWGYSDRTTGVDYYDMGYIANNYEEMARLIEKTITLATNPYQETLGEMFSVSVYYTGCYANFFRYLNEGNEAGLEKLEKQYQLVIDRFEENGYPHTYIPNISHFSIGDTIWEEADAEWKYARHRLPAGTEDETYYGKASVLNKKIAALGEITPDEKGEEIAAEVIKILEDYATLTDEEKALVIDINSVTAKLADMAEISENDDLKLKVMSFNVYYSKQEADRIARVVQVIENEDPDIIGIQEGMLPICDGILAAFGEKYEMLGIGREATDDSENSNVFYNTEKFELVDTGTIWLSRTPDRYSVMSGAGMPRIMTYQLLQRKSDGQTFLHANTHFDLNGTKIRTFEANVVMDFIAEEFGTMIPTVITGDFNCTADTPEFATIIDGGYSVTNAYGENVNTYQGWGEKEGKVIDFTFVNDMFPVLSYKVCDPTIDGEYASDHNAIISELFLMPTYESLTAKPVE